jgi:hypothetical protein
MNYFFRRGIHASVATLLLFILSCTASEGPVTISSLHRAVSRFVEAPWYYKNESVVGASFALYGYAVGEPIIPVVEMLRTIVAATDAIMTDQQPRAHWLSDRISLNYFQRSFVPSGSTMAVFSDLHGSIHSLLRSLHYLVERGYLNDDFTIKDPNFYFVFLGDYVDRGAFSPEVVYILAKLVVTNSSHVFLLRGNHDVPDVEQIIFPTSWRNDLAQRYGVKAGLLKSFFTQFFLHMPFGLYLGTANTTGGKDYMFFSHAGTDLTLNVHGILADEDLAHKYYSLGPVGSAYDGLRASTPYNWAYIVERPDKPFSESGNYILSFDNVNNWLSRINDDAACVHGIIRGHQHGGMPDYDPPLEEGHGYAAHRNVHTIFSGAGAGGVFLPFDSFLLLHTADDFSAWTGEHVYRKVGASFEEINKYSRKWNRWLLENYGLCLERIATLDTETRRYVLGESASAGYVPPLGDDSLTIDERIPWNVRPIVLSDIVCPH